MALVAGFVSINEGWYRNMSESPLFPKVPIHEDPPGPSAIAQASAFVVAGAGPSFEPAALNPKGGGDTSRHDNPAADLTGIIFAIMVSRCATRCQSGTEADFGSGGAPGGEQKTELRTK